MKYCFFDIECANCYKDDKGVSRGKICEFGYLITDENFIKIESAEYIINPKAPFQEYILTNMLAYPEQVYLNAKDYNYYYEKIKCVFELEDVIYIGHTIDADAKYLNDEALRYKKPFFNYKFYDAKYMYSAYSNIKNGIGLEKISQTFGNKNRHHAHRAEDDAYTTMLIVKEMCEKMDVDLLTLISLVEDCAGETQNGRITTIAREQAQARREEKEKSGKDNSNSLYSDNYIKFMQFLDGVKPQGEVVSSELNGKTLTITLNYQNVHFKEMLSIIQLLKNHDCTYKLKASECDYMVTAVVFNEDGTERTCSKLKYVNQAIAEGKQIKIITFEELLSILKTSEGELLNMPFPEESCFLKKNKKRESTRKERITYSSGHGGSTLGELLKAQGIDLSKIS